MSRFILAAGVRPNVAARVAWLLLIGVVVLLLAGGPSDAAEAQAAMTPHKVAIHVDEDDPARMSMALNNIANIRSYYQDKGEPVEIELVAYGPGLTMLRDDTSPVKDRVEQMAMEMPEVTFSGCGNTHAAMSRKAGKQIAMIDGARIVPSGAVRLMELQTEGYSYLRP